MSFYLGNKRGRRYEKIGLVVKWLANFDYSTLELIGKVLNVDYRGQSAFFKKLVTDDILERSYLPGTRIGVYSLGKEGFGLASLYCPELIIKEKKKKPSLITLVHTFSIQSLIANMHDKIKDFQSEKYLMGLNMARRPDAIVIMNDGKKVALEVEINRKTTDKIYYNFVNHIRDIKNSLYNSVEYYFNDASVAKLYISIYETPLWLIYKKSPTGGRLVKSEGSFDASSIHDGSLFKFTTKEMFTL